MTGADGWRTLDAELAAWAGEGRKASLWLRDDDATAPTDALERLLGLVEGAGVPLALAVIPAGAIKALGQRISGAKSVAVLQHGYAHANHADLGAKKSEFTDGRPVGDMTGELVAGRNAILETFGPAATAVLAPPWNRISAGLISRLAGCGIAGLSRYTPRKAPLAAPGVVEANAHVDLIDWRGGGEGVPADEIAAGIADHLRRRRTGEADAAEPTGVLAHHLQMDECAWDALARVLDRLAGDPRTTWPSAQAIFAVEAAA